MIFYMLCGKATLGDTKRKGVLGGDSSPPNIIRLGVQSTPILKKIKGKNPLNNPSFYNP